MDEKIKELTNKIYQEGVEKAKSDGKGIIDSAKGEAEKIIAGARNEAENIIANARKESEQLKIKTISELRMSSNQAKESLKQEIVNILSNASISESVKKSLNDVEFVKILIKDIVTKWDNSGKNMDLTLSLPEKTKSEFETFLKSKGNEILSKGVEIKFEGRMDNGFKIGPKDNSFILSFTDKDFLQFFQSFLKPKTKEILFSGE